MRDKYTVTITQSGSFLVKLRPQMRLVYGMHAGRVTVNLQPLTKR